MTDIKYLIKERDEDLVSLSTLIGIIKKRSVLFLIVLLVVIGVGSLLTFTTDPYFEVKFSLSSNVKNNEQVGRLLDRTGELVRKGDVVAVAKRLSITPTEAENVESIIAKNSYNAKDIYTVDVVVQLTDTSISDKVIAGIVSSLRSNSFLRGRMDEEKAGLQAIVSSAEIQRNRLDSISEVLRDKLYSNNASVDYPSNIHADAILLDTKIAENKEKLNLLAVAAVVDRPIVPGKASGPSKPLGLLLSIAAALVIAIGTVIVIEGVSATKAQD